MLFPTLQFALFFLFVWGVHRLLSPQRANGWLLGASLLFYFLWLPPYLLLLLVEIAANYLFLRRMCASAHPKRWLALSVASILGTLAFFKYGAFLIGNVNSLTTILDGPALPAPDLLLPLGISFYSFQIIALHVDVFRGEIRAPQRFRDYALFISFFPQLIAGPIVRGHELLPQLQTGAAPTIERTRRGLWLLASGLLKKVVIGDFLLAQTVESVFAAPGFSGAAMHIVGVYSFAFQIYFDFSGYTDMARGLACLLGFELPKNFEEPYLSRNPAEFWRRWHMTLSRWLRDYVYIPLGGNRKSRVRTGLNLLATMLLGGLWHGAGWNFVVWGGLHGVLLAAHRAFGTRADPERPLTWKDMPAVVLCFHAVCALWVFFRATDLSDALLILRTILVESWGPLPVWEMAVLVALAFFHLAERGLRPRLAALRARLGQGWMGTATEGFAFGAVIALTVAASGKGVEFIYFQF